jgi:hypothetical protein
MIFECGMLYNFIFAIIIKKTMLHIKKSLLPNSGMGLFTDKLIKKDQDVVEYKGEVVTWAVCEKRANENKGGYAFFITKNHCIDAFPTKNALGRYANDARGLARVEGLRNNSKYVVRAKKCYIVATRNIKPGEEILVHYGESYWRVYRAEAKKEALSKKSKKK